MEFKRYKGYSPDELRKKPAGPIASNTPDYSDLHAAMKARMATAAHFGNLSAQRMVSPNPPSYTFTGNEGVGVPKGETGTHFMSSMDNYAVPFIQQNKSGKMQFVPNANPTNREAIKFRTPEEARYFSEHYKDIAPMSNQYAWGGKMGLPIKFPKLFGNKKAGMIQGPVKSVNDGPLFPYDEEVGQNILLPETSVTAGNEVVTKQDFETQMRTDYEDNLNRVHEAYYKVRGKYADAEPLYGYSNSLNLTQGRYNTGKLPRELVQEMNSIAKIEGVDIYDLLAVAGRESTFGIGYGNELLPTTVISGWNLRQKYQPPTFERHLADMKLPFMTAYKDFHGYDYRVNNIDAYEKYLMENPQVFDKYMKKMESTPSPDYGQFNAYRELARMFKKGEMHKYNPGDPDYLNKLEKEKELLRKEKELTMFLDSLNSK